MKRKMNCPWFLMYLCDQKRIDRKSNNTVNIDSKSLVQRYVHHILYATTLSFMEIKQLSYINNKQTKARIS